MNRNTTSYWNITGEKTIYPRLAQSIETEVLIIGGGITGVTCAYCLAEKGLSPVLIEAGGLCDGTTGNTTGKITLQHDIIYNSITTKYGAEAAAKFAKSQADAVNFVRNTVGKEFIDCNLFENTAYVYAEKVSELGTLEKELDAAKQSGIEAELVKNADFPPGNMGLLGYRDQLVFHPVRYVNGLAKAAVAKGASIFCGTKAYKVEDGEIKTVFCENDIIIKAKHLVQATQYPIYDGPNLFYARLYPKRTYGIAVKAKRDWPDGSYINVGKPSRSIRTHVENGERILIIVGDSHYTGRGEYDMSVHFENLMQFAERVAGVGEVVAMWSAQDYDTPDKLPYIGRISDHSNVYIATGFRKWGLSTGTLSGMLLSELITTGNCPYEELYSRTRADFLTSPVKAFSGAFGPVYELIKSKLEGTESIENLQPGEGRVIRFEGEKAGIYRDYNDEITILDITCTHMGTELNFNNAEKTWDCPAHGGRFNTQGKLLEGAPKHSLRVLFRGLYQDLVGGEEI
jgi:glycine/D-amino acid oxidase-like deaminating enzyme/nitrite reductase/ring-hydroxylating ferredoxin subunit